MAPFTYVVGLCVSFGACAHAFTFSSAPATTAARRTTGARAPRQMPLGSSSVETAASLDTSAPVDTPASAEPSAEIAVGMFSGDRLPAPQQPEQAAELRTYIKCGRCSAVYLVAPESMGERGRRVKCSVCEHAWYQSAERVFRLGNGFSTQDFAEEKIATIRANLEAGLGANGAPRSSGRKGEMTMFVGNLPFSFNEAALAELFAPHGEVVAATVVTDDTGRSKGFGFVEMGKKAEGQAALATLHGHEINGRPITVRDGNAPRH
eukprot:TRINITY_DN336_c0_g2_i1.p1 TRINITY_DN336_c0_g2~~TRINITY_DN336_c0_g2_i1.p1  ORF type:complete len:278 (-),score=58.48 TRINITY_DN336_c0_g2_i1:202-993(-)